MTLRLEQGWEPGEPGGPGHGGLRFALWNLGEATLRPERLCYASMTRLGERAAIEGGQLARRFGGHVEIAAPEGLAVAPGGAWRLVLSGLAHAPANRAQGAMAAWIETAEGPLSVEVGDLAPPADEGAAGAEPEGAGPEGAGPAAAGFADPPDGGTPGAHARPVPGTGAAAGPPGDSAGAPATTAGPPDAPPAAPATGPDARALADAPPRPARAGGAAPPIALLPWPAEVDVGAPGGGATLHPWQGADPAPFALVSALHRRLYPEHPGVIALDPVPGGRRVRPCRDAALPPGGYALSFGEPIALRHADADGLRHGLIALAQMAHGARGDARLGVPREGRIRDRPRFAWRGAMLDVARNHHGPATVARLIDALAWHRMSHLHWHLSDDEGWRLPSAAYPDLPRVGGARGRGLPLPPQFSDGLHGQRGAYTAAEIRALVAHAASLGVAIAPEIDTPGHAKALLAAIPDLADPGEPPDAYRSIQGYPNNALNPGMARTYAVLETLLGEIADLFPSRVLHLGGDEVAEGAWSASPQAQALARREGLSGTVALQSHFLRRIQGMVRGLGRRMGGWDECALGEGVARDAVLFAWRSQARVAELVAEGYEVVASPGEAYYLDMVDRAGWDAPGTSWAGPVTAEATYRHEVGAPEGPGRLLGVQACLWGEHLARPSRLDAMARPRLSAVAEAAWTPPKAKDWARFAALAPLMPRLLDA